jgi:hypothetical protein
MIARVRITKTGRRVHADNEDMSRKAELDAILQCRPDLKGKSLEAAKRIVRREARLSLKPRRTRAPAATRTQLQSILD